MTRKMNDLEKARFEYRMAEAKLNAAEEVRKATVAALDAEIRRLTDEFHKAGQAYMDAQTK